MNKSLNPQLTKQVIIGTKSQSRRKIFKLMNLKFQYRSPNINEKKVKDLNNDKYDALKIAKAKAEYLSKKYSNKIIVTFDTTILFKKNISFSFYVITTYSLRYLFKVLINVIIDIFYSTIFKSYFCFRQFAFY